MKRVTPKPHKKQSEAGWETVIDFTEIKPEGVSGKELLASLRALRLN